MLLDDLLKHVFHSSTVFDDSIIANQGWGNVLYPGHGISEERILEHDHQHLDVALHLGITGLGQHSTHTVSNDTLGKKYYISGSQPHIFCLQQSARER